MDEIVKNTIKQQMDKLKQEREKIDEKLLDLQKQRDAKTKEIQRLKNANKALRGVFQHHETKVKKLDDISGSN